MIFDKNIFDTTGHQMIVSLFTALNVCFCTTRGKQNQQNTVFLSNGALLLN